MSRNAFATILLAASISFTACGGGSKSSDSTTTPSAQNEQAPVPGAAVPSETTAGTTGTTTDSQAVPGVTTGDTTGTGMTGDRQPVSGTTSDTTGMGTSGSTSGTAGTTGTSGSMSGTTSGTGDTSGSATSPNTTGQGSTSVRPPGGTMGSTSGTTSDSSGTTSGTSGSMGSDTAGSAAGASGAMTEAGIFAALDAVNQHEIDAGQLALNKAKNKDVKKLARTIVDDHKKLQASVDKLANKINVTPEATSDVTAMKDDARTQMEKLQGLDGAEFDREFVDQMVQGHEKALTMIDNQMMPASSSNDQIQSTLKTARSKIESHLDKARKLQAKLGGASDSKMQ